MLKVASVFKDETDRRPSQNSKANLSAKQQASREVNTNSANNSEISNNLYAEKDNRSSNSTDTSIQKKQKITHLLFLSRSKRG